MAKLNSPKKIEIVQGLGYKWQIREEGQLLFAGKCEPYVNQWGEWATKAEAEVALDQFKKQDPRFKRKTK